MHADVQFRLTTPNNNTNNIIKAVGIRVEIFRIYDIVAAESHFTCDFEVFMEWCDPSIIGIHSLDSSKQPGGRNNVGCFDPQGGWKPAWTPHLLFHNQYV